MWTGLVFETRVETRVESGEMISPDQTIVFHLKVWMERRREEGVIILRWCGVVRCRLELPPQRVLKVLCRCAWRDYVAVEPMYAHAMSV